MVQDALRSSHLQRFANSSGLFVLTLIHLFSMI